MRFFVFLFLFSSYYLSVAQTVDYYHATYCNNAIYAFSDDYIILAGSGGRMIKTGDGGDKWFQVEIDIKNDINYMDFSTDGFGFCATENDIFISNDSGASWTNIYSGPDPIIGPKIFRHSRTILFSENNSLFAYDTENLEKTLICSVGDTINNFCLSGMYYYIISDENFYCYKGSQPIYKHSFKGKYTSTLVSVIGYEDYVLVCGYDKLIVNDTIKSSGVLVFESYNNGETFLENEGAYGRELTIAGDYIAKLDQGHIIIRYKPSELPDENNQISDTVTNYDYMRCNSDLVSLKKISYSNGKIYFCGYGPVWGYLVDGGSPKVKNYARTYIPLYYLGVPLRGFKNWGDKMIAYGKYGKILYSSDGGIMWDQIFPIDTTTQFVENSPWFKYGESRSNFISLIPYKNGFRFLGKYMSNQPLDIYMDTTTMHFEDLKELTFYGLAQNGPNIAGVNSGYINYSTDNGHNWEEITFPGKGTGFPDISATEDENIFVFILEERLDTNDANYDYPNVTRSEKLFTLDVTSGEIEEKYKVFNDEQPYRDIARIPGGDFILYNAYDSIRIFDKGFNYKEAWDIDFFANYIYSIDENKWIALSREDSIFLSTNGGKDWKPFVIGCGINGFATDLSLELNKIVPLDTEGDYFIVGSNRLVKVKIDFEAETVEDIEAVETIPLMIYPPYPNPTKKTLNLKMLWDSRRVEFSDIKAALYDIRGVKIADLECSGETYYSTNYATLKYDIGAIKTGVYYVRVDAGAYCKSVLVSIVK